MKKKRFIFWTKKCYIKNWYVQKIKSFMLINCGLGKNILLVS